MTFAWDAYQTMRDGNHVLSEMIIGSLNVYVVSAHGLESQNIFGGNIGENFFESLGVRPAIGRLISDRKTSRHSAPVAVMSYSFWKSRFNRIPDIIGQKIISATSLSPSLAWRSADSTASAIRHSKTFGCPIRSRFFRSVALLDG